tara:strand:- start:5911 stop:6087 length:177 start_codon:yes stop_codon:yes gene_type:complete
MSKNKLIIKNTPKNEIKKMTPLEKNIKKTIEGEGMKELTDKLKKLNVKDTMKNIRITF